MVYYDGVEVARWKSRITQPNLHLVDDNCMMECNANGEGGVTGVSKWHKCPF